MNSNEITNIVNEILNKNNNEKLLTSKEAAELIKVSRRWLNTQALAGALPYYRIGKKMLYKKKDILDFIEYFKMDSKNIINNLVR